MLTVVSLVATINGLLTWIGRGFGITELTLQLILRYIFYPVTFFMGVPRNEILRVAELLATWRAHADLFPRMALHDAAQRSAEPFWTSPDPVDIYEELVFSLAFARQAP